MTQGILGKTPASGPRPRESTESMELDARSWALLDAARHGDRESLGVLYRTHAAYVRRYIQSKVGSAQLAEDFTSDVFLRVLGSLGSVRRQDGKFRAWLMTISRNVVFDHFKSKRRLLEVSYGVLPEGARFELSAEQLVLQRQLREMVWAGLRRLLPDQRDCLRMRFFEGRSVAETAVALCRSETATRQLQHRATRTLLALFAPLETSG